MHNGNKLVKYDNIKIKSFKQTLMRLINDLKSFKGFLIISIIMSLFSAILTINGPNKVKEMTNIILLGIKNKIDITKINELFLILLVMYLFSWIFNCLQNYINTTIAQNFIFDLRQKLSKKLNNIPLKFFDNNSYGNILSKITNDIDALGVSLGQSVGTFISSTTLILGSIYMMFTTSIPLALTAIISSFLGIIFMKIIITFSQKHFKIQQLEIGNLNGHIEEMFNNHNIVKVYNGSDDAIIKFDDINNKLAISSRKSNFYSGLMGPIMGFISNFSYVCVCIVGSILVMESKIEFGVIVAFMLYIKLFTNPLNQLAQAMTNIQLGIASSERIYEFLDEEELINEDNKTKVLRKENVKGDIVFKNVSFSYNPDKLIINDFSANIKRGSKVAIVGPTGAGKTTIVNLLMRFYEIDKGDILIDNISIKDLTRNNIHNLFCMVLQDTWIFNASIKDNIIYNKENITFKQVEDACKTVGLHHYIQTLPQGYDTILTDNDNLSNGQKQMLTIARALIENDPFLILDEATSNVDTRTERLIQSAMDKLMINRTSFIIAHRLSTIKNADIILVMDQGNIVEQGNHDELLKLNSVYANLYNSQFENS